MPRLPLAGDARHLHGTARDLPRTLAEIRPPPRLRAAGRACRGCMLYSSRDNAMRRMRAGRCPAASDLLAAHARIGPQVGPRFNTKYQTAAESALNHCYRSCLEVLRCAAGPPLVWLGALCCAPLHGTQARPSLHCSCRTATGWQSPCDA